ncbi:hypothetical protein [Pontibacter sp. G13]|uniref:hypothetical protein n=1 Tax=Pontibacter sp. G13 TaxID=3074898 RepID=UPI00288A2257|nr:hypothetical protein [Pontibacter sp. G13]WNJ16726.1 hypothetical protein RJD25_17810 [Pontibacter sp. G13]
MKSNHIAQGFLILAVSVGMLVSVHQTERGIIALLGDDTDSETQYAANPADTLSEPAMLEVDILAETPSDEPIAMPDEPPLSRFFEEWERVRTGKGKLRVAYFGDSMIEGDLVTQSLRDRLQQQYGGTGVGFVPITSQTYGFRKSIKHRFSSDWKDFSFLKSNPTKHDFGISGEFFLTRKPGAKGTTWVKYEATDLYPGTQVFEQCKLYFGRPLGSEGKLEVGQVLVQSETGTDTIQLVAEGEVNQVLLTTDSTTFIQLDFQIPTNLPVYGLSFESEEGILVDNFASRGNSGLNLRTLPGETLGEFHAHMDYDLIVLQFGLNVIRTDRKNYDFYKRGMRKVIAHFQQHMPETDILLVSVSDKSTRINGRMQTDPSIPHLINAQCSLAEEMNVGFLNLFEEMGGENSMVEWVRSNPSLARKDYTHPNLLGADKLGSIVSNYFMEEYYHFHERQGTRQLAGL